MLAIVIPYYKLIFFEDTLQSLANQTDKRFRVYIGDDASPEKPITILEKYKGQFEFIYHRFENNLGGISLTKQWERCIALSGDDEWIMILGDDDVLEENVVEEFFKKLSEIERNKINVVRYSTRIIDEKGQVISDIYKHPKLEKATSFIVKKLKKETRSSLSEYIFEKSNVLNVGFKNFPLGWYSDDMAILDFSNYSLIFTINESRVLIRYSDYSLSGSDYNKKEKDIAKFSFFWLLYSQRIGEFDSIQGSVLREQLITSFLNRIFIKHYFKILYYSISKFSFDIFIEVNYRLINLLKHEFKIK